MSSSDQDGGGAEAPSAKRSLFIAAVIVAASAWSVGFQGFNFPMNNNAIQVPILQHAANPQLYPNDPFVATLSRYSSVVWWGLAKFRFDDWFWPLLVLHCATRVFFFWAFFRIASDMIPDWRKALVGTALLGTSLSLLGASSVGLSDLLIKYFNHSEIAFALLLFCYSLALRHRYRSAAIGLGLCFNINAFVTAWGLFGVLCLQIQEVRRPLDWRSWTPLAKTVLLVLVLAAPTLWTLLHSPGPAVPFDYRTYVKEYFPYHFYWKIPWIETLQFALRILTALLSLSMLPRGARVRVLFLAHILLMAFGLLLPLLTGSRVLLNLQLIRADCFLDIITVLATVGLCVELLSTQQAGLALIVLVATLLNQWMIASLGIALLHYQSRPQRRGAFALLLAMIVVWALVLQFWGRPERDADFGPSPSGEWQPIPAFRAMWLCGPVLLFVLGRCRSALHFALPVIAINLQANPQFPLGILGLLCLPLLEASDKRLRAVGYLAPGFYAISIPVLVPHLALGWPIAGFGCLMCFGAYREIARHEVQSAPAWRFFAVGVVAAMMLFNAPRIAMRFAAGTISHTPLPRVIVAWFDVQKWARRSTPVVDNFIVPYRTQGFRLWSERSSWVDWKDGGAAMWAPEYYGVWIRRVRELKALCNAEELLRYGQRNGIAFAILENTPNRGPWLNGEETGYSMDVERFALPPSRIAYRNDFYSVVDLRP